MSNTVLGTVDDSIVKFEFPKDPLSSSVKGILGNQLWGSLVALFFATMQIGENCFCPAKKNRYFLGGLSKIISIYSRIFPEHYWSKSSKLLLKLYFWSRSEDRRNHQTFFLAISTALAVKTVVLAGSNGHFSVPLNAQTLQLSSLRSWYSSSCQIRRCLLGENVGKFGQKTWGMYGDIRLTNG